MCRYCVCVCVCLVHVPSPSVVPQSCFPSLCALLNVSVTSCVAPNNVAVVWGCILPGRALVVFVTCPSATPLELTSMSTARAALACLALAAVALLASAAPNDQINNLPGWWVPCLPSPVPLPPPRN